MKDTDSKATYPGIPAKIDLDFVRKWVKPRVSDKRYRHIEGVASVGRKIAKHAGCDPFLAELCGWLHDACKEVKDVRLVEMAREYNLPLDDILIQNGQLLHGPVAAALVKAELGITNQEVLKAIAEHTLGAVPMTDLSKVAFLADCLEEGRPTDYTDPIWKALDLKGATDLDRAIVVASDLGLKHVIESGRAIHPTTVAVRNYYLQKLRAKNAN